MIAVRAKATTGFISGKAANSGRRMKPVGAARRSDEFERVADRRRVERPQSFEIGGIGQVRHRASSGG